MSIKPTYKELEQRVREFENKISERKQAEKNLFESQRRYQALFENMNAGFVLFEVVQDDNGVPVDLIIIEANKGFEITTGLKRRDVTGKYLTRVLPDIENDAADWIGTYGKVALTGESLQFEQASELLGHYYSIIAYQARPKQCAVTFLDISERKQWEEALQVRDQKIIRQNMALLGLMSRGTLFGSDMVASIKEITEVCSEVVETERVSVWWYNDDHSFIRCFDVYERSKGHHSEGEELRSENFSRYKKSHKKGEIIVAENVRTDLRTREIPSSYWEKHDIYSLLDAPIWLHGRVRGLLSFENVGDKRQWSQEDEHFCANMATLVSLCFEAAESNRAQETNKALEAQLQQAQKMEAVGTLAGGIAHDFNNILGAILINTELALEVLKDDEKVRRRLENVYQSSLRAADLVRQILTFSRRSDKELGVVRVTPIIKEALKLLRASLPTTIEIHEHMDAKTDWILGDPTQVHQVLMNLCTNAKHAMHERGGLLEVTLKDVSFESEEGAKSLHLSSGRFLRLTVTDTGRGIPSDIGEKIFDPYFSTKAKGEGTGLGLSVVHGIVSDHGGTISVSSEEGKGTTFEVYFPISKDQQIVEQKPAKPALRGSENILLVDDEIDLVDGYGTMLKNLGYQVVGKTSSKEALEAFRKQPKRFDLVLTDYTMPHLTGIQLAEELLKIRPDLPVIIYTGFTEDIASEEAKSRGIREMVSKPLSMGEISEVLRRCLS